MKHRWVNLFNGRGARSAWRLLRSLTGVLLTLAGHAPATASALPSTTAQPPAIHRVDEIRALLLAHDARAAARASRAEGDDADGVELAQWANWAKWQNWSKWNNWGKV
jgi:hypothetical protein